MKQLSITEHEEMDRIKNQLGELNPNLKFKLRTTQRIAKQILLDGFYFYNGRGLTPYAKSIGCGVYEVWVIE